MPFGKYKGRRLCEIDIDYLEWLATLPDLRDPLRSALEDILGQRAGRHSRPRALPQPEVVAEIVNAGYRALANKYHPDRPGGDPEKMVQLNNAIEWLRAVRP
jgi:hypothetical protein